MSWRGHLLLFLLLVPLLNTLAVLALPYAINAYAVQRVVKLALAEAAIPSDDPAIQGHKNLILERGGVNVALPAQRADARTRTIVRPSPDLLYTACVFDLGPGPLHVTAPVPDSYLSVSGFAADTSNFFAINDRDIAASPDAPREIDLWLSSDATPTAPAIKAPSRRGLVLFRTLVQDRTPDPALLALRRAQRCEPAGRQSGGAQG